MIRQRHLVEFYHDDEFLIESVTSVIKVGIQVNDTVIVVATDKHRDELKDALTPGELANEKLIFVNAEGLLTKFMVDGWPDESLFLKAVGGIVRPACRRGRVRVFGEMMALLWAEGKSRAAFRLEELWNKLGVELPFTLLCAYPMSEFSSAEDRESIEAICRIHTHAHNQAFAA